MNYVIEQRIDILLKGRYRQDEVASIIAVEHPELNEFDLEDLPAHITRIAKGHNNETGKTYTVQCSSDNAFTTHRHGGQA